MINKVKEVLKTFSKSYLATRVKAFAWQLGAMAVVTVIGFIVQPDIVNAIGLPEVVVAILGLVAGGITKWLNTEGISPLKK